MWSEEARRGADRREEIAVGAVSVMEVRSRALEEMAPAHPSASYVPSERVEWPIRTA